MNLDDCVYDGTENSNPKWQTLTFGTGANKKHITLFVLKVYLIPPGYEAKLLPSALLSYKGKRCSSLHKRTAGHFDSVASAPELPLGHCLVTATTISSNPLSCSLPYQLLIVNCPPLARQANASGPYLWATV